MQAHVILKNFDSDPGKHVIVRNLNRIFRYSNYRF